jgi:hypothetical protein
MADHRFTAVVEMATARGGLGHVLNRPMSGGGEAFLLRRQME